MTSTDNKIDIKSLSFEQLKNFISQMGESQFRALQVWQWLYRGVESFDEMSNLSKNVREKLDNAAYINIFSVERELKSKDGTVKYLFRLMDGNFVESVVMEYNHGTTICISTQVGCNMGCKFCASTIGGRIRNLSPSEMADQIIYAQKKHDGRITNVVLMGIGEPLDNYENVLQFLKNINDDQALNIGMRRISLSTCGLCDKIDMLAQEKLGLTLSISLHAPNNELRNMIMPINKKYPIECLIKSCRNYIKITGRRISFEYALIDGLNDTRNLALQLADLLRGMQCHVNLIPVNEVKELGFKPSPQKTINEFVETLEAKGINVTVRRKLGSDIDASCGQLRRSRMK